MPSYDATELAARLGSHPVEAARSLTALETLGLAARSSSGTGRYVASPPSVALAALAVQHEEEFRRVDMVSADTRLQLGFHADRQGWI